MTKSPLHVLIIPSWYPKDKDDISGVFFRDQALSLKQQGLKVGVLALYFESILDLQISRFPKKHTRQSDEGILTYRVFSYRFLPRSEKALLSLWKVFLRIYLKKYIKENGKPDVVHAHGAIYAGISATEICENLDIPVVLTEHSTGYAREIFSDYLIGKSSNTYKKAEKLIAVSEDFKNLLERKFPNSKDKWTFIPNIISSRFFEAELIKNKSKDIFKIGTLSLLTAKKGHFDLLEAYAMTIPDYDDMELHIAGDGELRQDLENFCDEHNLRQKVKFIGSLPPKDAPEFLKSLDLFILPSHYETFGVVLIEAMASGVPVLATDCGGPASIIKSKKLGELAPKKSPRTLAQKIRDIRQNYSYDPVYIREFAKDNFSSTVVAKKIIETYLDVIRN